MKQQEGGRRKLQEITHLNNSYTATKGRPENSFYKWYTSRWKQLKLVLGEDMLQNDPKQTFMEGLTSGNMTDIRLGGITQCGREFKSSYL